MKINYLTRWHKILLDKLAVDQQVKKFHVTHKNWRFIAMFTKPRQ